MTAIKLQNRIKILDSIRGIAALVVLFHHIFKLNTLAFKENLNDWMFALSAFISERNHDAVLVFFIISGISIGLTVSKRPVSSTESCNQYLYRRFKRILPIYWLSLIVALFFGLVMGQGHLKDFSMLNLLGNFFFLQTSSSIPQSWFVPYGLNGPLWSLAFEMFFYLLFPILFILSRKHFSDYSIYTKYSAMLIVALFCIVFNKKVIFIPYLIFYVSFLIWYQGYVISKFFTGGKTHHIFFLVNGILGISLLFLRDIIPSDSLQVIGKGMCIGSIFYFGVIVFSRFNFNIVGGFINKAFFNIGEGSYAIYALHYPILLYFQSLAIDLVYQLLMMAVYIVICIKIERISTHWKVSFLKVDYFSPVRVMQTIFK